MKSRRLIFYLLREEIREFNDALDPDKTSVQVGLTEASGLDGCFVYKPPRESTPPWVQFMQPVLADDIRSLTSRSLSALLLLRSNDRIFAISFGYGRSLLNLAKIEFQFGLRVALNRIDPSQIRSLDTKTYEDLVVSTSTQVSRSAELPSFGVDISKDILRAVTGEPRDEKFAKRLAGANSLVMNTVIQANELPALCDELLESFTADDYKANFAWIDQLTLVQNVEEIAVLDEQLISELRTGVSGATHLAMPEAIEWEDIDAFKIGGTRRHVYDDLDLDEYLVRLGDERASLSLSNLQSRSVSVRFGRSGQYDKRWRLYDCLVTEQRLDQTLYVLIEGRWFLIDETLVASVDRFVSSLPDAQVDLIPAQMGEKEADYNERLARHSSDRLLKLDAKIKRPGGAASGIEFCDLLSDSGDLIHVKRRSRSATLSHLFAQGFVSAETFLSDGYFREQIREIIEQEIPGDEREVWLDLIPQQNEPVTQANYCITYVVVTNSSRDGRDWLPFFSKLNLRQQGRQLLNMGFDVAIAKVPVEVSTGSEGLT